VFSAVGGTVWAAGVTLLGYYLGTIDFVANNVEVMLLAFVAIAIVPVAIEYLRDRAAAKLKED
jgi:membrane-associated protein